MISSRVWFTIVSLIWIGLNGFAHDDPHASVPSVAALKVNEELTVDGRLTEPFWIECEIATDFIDTRTQKPAEDQSVVRIAYTREYLYFAVECFDRSIQDLHASERREDRQFAGDDWVEVHFDPTHSHRSKYAFFSNPLGTKSDANEGPSGVFNRGWTVEWDLAATIGDDRWTFEMRIPFSVLNYYQSDNQTWGLNFTRYLVRSDVTSFWSYNPTDFYKPRYFGHLTGLDLADSVFNHNLEITPYISTRVDFNDETHSLFQTGVDVNYRLTPSITSAWTINPDFGQVEADDDTIELRDTERFLEEKRLFFREGNELLNMRKRLYYSRRFTDIQTGAKISGEWDEFKFALFNIHGDTSHDEVRYGNSTIVRAIQNIGERSTLGYYLSAAELEDGHSRVASMDGELFIDDDWRYLFQTSAADDRNWEGHALVKDRVDFLGNAALRYSRYPWSVDIGYDAITDEFNPALGYIPRRDIFGPYTHITYNHQADDRFYKDLFVGFDTALYGNEDGSTTLRDYDLFSKLVFPNDMGIKFSQQFDYHNPYDNVRTSAGFVLNDSDFYKRTDFDYAIGEFEDTRYHEFEIGKNFKPFDRWPIRYEFVIRFEDRPDGNEDTVWLNRIVFDYYFTDVMWLKTSLQHRDEHVHNISVIYGWEFVKDAHWYLVFNSVADEGEDTVHSVFAKITYTFR